MAIFVGEFDQTIDAKHRLMIPAALRERMDPDKDGREFILVRAEDGHLWLYPDVAYGAILEQLNPLKVPVLEAGKVAMLFGMARTVRPDKQGRIVLPEKSMQRAVISDEVTLVGVLDHIEIWPRAAWEQHVEENLPVYGQVLHEAAGRLRDAAEGQDGKGTS